MKSLIWLGLSLSLTLAGCAHVPLGGTCESNGQCIGHLVCNGGVCAKGNCNPLGGKCSTNDDCCGTLFCSDRTCH